MSRSYLFRILLVCVVLCLLLSVDAVEAKKGNTKKKDSSNAAAATAEANNAAASKNEAKDVPQSSSASSSQPSADELALKELHSKQLKRKRELLRKKREKQEKKRAASLQQARSRNRELAEKRKSKIENAAKAKARAKQAADDLVAKKRAADTPEIRKRGHEKLRWLMGQTSKSGSRMISFDTANFNTYVNEGPRPYHLLLVFTALTGQHSCYYCHVADQALVPVAQAHFERSKDTVSRILAANSTADIPENELPVFFANIDMAKNPALFKELNFNSAPYILLAPPRLGTKTLKSTEFVKGLGQKYRFNLQANMAPNDFLGFINKLALIHVHLEDAKPGITDLLGSLIVLSGLAFALFKWGLLIVMKAREIRWIRFLLLFCGLGLYCWCISGGMYNIIRGTQFAETNKDGSTNYINGDARDQFAAEGLIIGVLNIACATFIIFINTRSFDDSYQNVAAGGKGAKLSPFQHLKNAISPYFSPVVCLFLFSVFWFKVISIYTQKNWGYRMGFVWR